MADWKLRTKILTDGQHVIALDRPEELLSASVWMLTGFIPINAGVK
jgi:hypothetical protein